LQSIFKSLAANEANHLQQPLVESLRAFDRFGEVCVFKVSVRVNQARHQNSVREFPNFGWKLTGNFFPLADSDDAVTLNDHSAVADGRGSHRQNPTRHQKRQALPLPFMHPRFITSQRRKSLSLSTPETLRDA